jgi:hypothetical protein
MSIDAGPGSMDWVAVGTRACALVFGGRIATVVYWQGADGVQPGDCSGVRPVSDAGFWWVPAELPVDRFFLFHAPDPAESDWVRARELAANAYLEWRLEEAGRTAELRREAAELLSRSRWWHDDRMRDHL